MVGHGGPRASQGRRLSAARSVAVAGICRSALAALLALAGHAALADDMRVRIAWGGGADRVWQGTISVSDGSLSEPQPLGIEADEPGSMWLAGDAHGSQKLVIQQRSPRGYDGVDVLVSAPMTAKLHVELTAADDSARATTIEAPLADLNGEFVNKELDTRGNRLLLMRTPGDSLRVGLARDSLVFAPGEVLKGTLEPHLLPLAEDGRARIKVQLFGSGGKELWSQQHDVQAGHEEKIPLEITLPGEEGVYDVAIVAVNNPNWSQAVRQPLNWKRTIAERRVQLLVLGPAAAGRAAGRSRLHPGGGDRSGQSAVVREAQQAAAVAVDQDPAAAAVEGAAGQRLLPNQTVRAGRAGPVEAQRRLARRELGGVLAADHSAGPSARRGSGLSRRRAADLGHQHRGAQRRRGADAHRPGFRRGPRGGGDSVRPPRRIGRSIG